MSGLPGSTSPKAIGILLVVMGHCLDGLHSAGIVGEISLAWLGFYLIYCFHMPLFFFLTGSLVEARISAGPGRFLQAGLTRIAYPYILWGSVQTTMLLLAPRLINHPVSQSLGRELLSIIWAPPGQFWFLYVLFFLHMTALLTISLGGRLLFALIFAVLYALYAVSQHSNAVMWDYFSGTNILFYVLGVCVGGPLVGWRGRVAQPFALVLLSLILFLASAWVGWTTQASWYSYVTLPAAFAGSAVVLLFSRTDTLNGNRWLSYLGRRSMPIYLLHVMFVAGTRIVLTKAFDISSLGILLPAIFLAGAVGPLIVERTARSLRLQTALGLA